MSAEPDPSLTPLGLTVHSIAPPALEGQRRTALGRWQMLAVLAVCAAPVVASYFTYFVVRPEARTNYSPLITPPRALPEALPLTDASGQAVPARGLKGQWLLVVVSGAACDTRCEKNLVLVRQLRETLGRDKDRVDKVWFIVDGGKPGEAVLKASGASAYGVPREALAAWLAPAEGQSLESHVYLVDPMGQWMMRPPVDPDPPRLKRDIERLLRAAASWDQPGR